jgi:hypothetical protein
MQKLNVAKHILNLKYGLGLELNNYRYKQHIRYKCQSAGGCRSSPCIIGRNSWTYL